MQVGISLARAKRLERTLEVISDSVYVCCDRHGRWYSAETDDSDRCLDSHCTIGTSTSWAHYWSQ